MKLGLNDPRPGAVKLRLATYCDFAKLPKPPENFGHYSLVRDWGMLGNDEEGDCALAGACHQDMLWTLEGGNPAAFDTPVTVNGVDYANAALANYGELTQWDPNAGPPGENPTDQGTDIGQLADYWVNTGLVDSQGKRHKVAAVVDLNPGDLRELWVATYLFQSIGMGFNLPDSAERQTREGKPWDVVRGATIVGGHYVPAFGRVNSGEFGVGVTWGQTQLFTPRFYERYNNQGICALSEEMLIKSVSIDGFDDKLLRADLAAL
jgi:hypothetical protein